MRIDPDTKVRQVAGENIIIRVAGGADDMTTVMALNESALDIYNTFKGRDFTLDDVVRRMVDTYDVDAATARKDAEEWLRQMRKQGLLTD